MRCGSRTQRAAALGLVLLAGCTAGRATPASPQARSADARFLLTFWCGPPLAELDDARAAEIAAAGFTVIGAPCEGGFDPALNRRALDVAHRHGLRLWVHDLRFSPAASEAAGWPAAAYAAVGEYRDHPGLEGYFVVDEPPASEFARVATVAAALRSADPTHPAYINLLPNYVPPELLGADSYDAYLDEFITAVHPRLLSYDYYPFGKEKDRSTFFANLEAMRAAALRHDLPFMLIVLAMPHGPYRDPSEAELAWQVNHALAYGARGVSYFAYWTPPSSDEEWQNRYGLIEDGRPTLHYFQIARLNREVRAVAAALRGFGSVAVADSAGEIGVPLPIGPIEAIDGGPVTAGLFGDGAGRLAVLLVNRDYRYGVTAQVRLRDGALPPQRFDAVAARWQASRSLSFLLPPGGSQLLGWGMSTDSRA